MNTIFGKCLKYFRNKTFNRYLCVGGMGIGMVMVQNPLCANQVIEMVGKSQEGLVPQVWAILSGKDWAVTVEFTLDHSMTNNLRHVWLAIPPPLIILVELYEAGNSEPISTHPVSKAVMPRSQSIESLLNMVHPRSSAGMLWLRLAPGEPAEAANFNLFSTLGTNVAGESLVRVTPLL